MSGSLLANLPAADAIGDADLFYSLQGGADKKATGAQIRTYAGGLIRTSVAISSQNAAIGTVPGGAGILQISLQETSGHDVSCSLGTGLGGSQLLGTTLIPGGGPPVLIPLLGLEPPSSWVADQVIFLTSPSWGLANVLARMWVVS